MNSMQQWSYRLFLLIVTTVLVLVLGWLGTVASNLYIGILENYKIELAPEKRWLVSLGFIIIGILLALLLGSWLTQRLWTMRDAIEKLPLADKVAVLFGVLIGMALAYLVVLMPLMLLRSKEVLAPTLAVAIIPTLLMVYFSVHTLLKVREAISTSFPQLTQILRVSHEIPEKESRAFRTRDKLVDTSVIIDGRLADIVRTGFIEGRLLIPLFVLNELQTIAGSEDELRRARGRRGLGILETLKTLSNTVVEVVDQFSHEVETAPSTDLKLVRLAKEFKASIITNDNNLQKIAELQGIPVLCVNELATALKPIVLPSEDLVVVIQKSGKEAGQGIGYLEDGTMVVVERGRHHIGHEVRIKVNSVLQTPMGKMIFGDFKEVVRKNVVKAEGGDLFDDDFDSSRRWSRYKT